ncbi:hypothetical protein C1Y40_05199 [Mycobacterium talmoniae]|uniref:Uncharacterized protein n=1 Tax=Mycobacterium talmoniae TaxID=1858794 RepID=A0A2S8BDA1_9MYCO|nr:hypothetical protein C1Y40_05199 [Mycobacterium talmoniae]
MEAGSARSSGAANTAAPRARSPAANRSHLSPLLPSTTRSPPRATRAAVARPIDDDASVITTARPPWAGAATAPADAATNERERGTATA